ncbi:MAG: hypothetical protein K6U74_19550 [Firmicutes bacterium]|nr:hypothetical protein [Bacillota bacterium]
MGKNIFGNSEKGFAYGPRAERKKMEEESYLDGRNLGYHLGYNLGFESGYERGYAEGSSLGYNNGFLAALKLGEGSESFISGKVPDIRICRILKKMIAGGAARIFLSGGAAGEAKILLRLLEIEAAVINRETHS